MNNRLSVCLIGMMGAGKSTVGLLLAERLERPFIDMDGHIESTEGMSIEAIFKGPGEHYFRELEGHLLPQIIGDNVIACGGGIVTLPESRAVLSNQSTLYLRATVATLESRLKGGGARPLLPTDQPLPDQLRRLLEERRNHYESSAQWIVDVDNLPLGEIVDIMVTRIMGHPA